VVVDNANRLGRIQQALKVRTLFGRREAARDTLL
jgi:hypothetical protein